MTTPDQTAAFDADAAHATDDVDALRARVAELEARTTTNDGDGDADSGEPTADGKAPIVVDGIEVIDPNATAADEVAKAPETVTLHGKEFRFHVPNQAAMMAFSLGAASPKRGKLMLATMQNFLAFHLIEEDFDEFLSLMMDPQEEAFSQDTMGDLISAIVDVANDTPEARAPKTGPRR